MALRKSTKHQNGAAHIMRKLKILGLGSDLDGGGIRRLNLVDSLHWALFSVGNISG